MEKLFDEIKEYLDAISDEDIDLMLEAMQENFVVITERIDGELVVLSKDWKDSYKIHQGINMIIAKNLFSGGYPNWEARNFCEIYLHDKVKPNSNDILNFLVKRYKRNKKDITNQ
jgi:hypothetical protein